MTGSTSTLDQLVPAPWSARRRAAVAGLLAALLTAFGALGWSGLVVPNLVGGHLGGGTVEVGRVADGRVVDTAVTVRVAVENRGWVAAELTGWEPPATTGIDWRENAEPLPTTLAPGERRILELAATIPDCAEVAAHGAEGFGVVATGPAGITLTRPVEVDGIASTPQWFGHDDGRAPLDPSARAPSWVYSALDWACDPEAHG